MICAVVLAAGRSRRMGVQKLLLPFAGKTVIGHIVDQVLRGPVDRAVVVVGKHEPLVAEALNEWNVELAINAEPEGDMLSSVRCGVRALPAQCEAFLVTLGDQPSVTSSVVREIVRAFQESGGRIIIPTQHGKRGHPLLVPMRYAHDILTRYDGVGLHGLLAQYPQDVVELPVTAAGILDDIDSPEDYRRELSRQRGFGEG